MIIASNVNSKDWKNLHDLCINHNFIKKGKSYFRIVGDGVLQLIQLIYERGFSHYSLNIGLKSMYDRLSKGDVSSLSSIETQCVLFLRGQSTAVSITVEDGLTEFNVASVSEQIKILENEGFDWLDAVDTQEALSIALEEMDKGVYKSVIWNRHIKLAPFLATKNYLSAERVISSILQQHMGPAAITYELWQDEEYKHYEEKFPGRDAELLQIHNWIAKKDVETINAYICNNYAKNQLICKKLPHKTGDGSKPLSTGDGSKPLKKWVF